VKLINSIRKGLLQPVVLGLVSVVATIPFLKAQPPPGYHMVFADEFEKTQLDPEKWITTMHFVGAQGGRFHNIAYLNYNLDENILFENGLLRLQADKQPTVGFDPPGLYQYSGALISTDGKFQFTYGYVEIRAKYPGGRGVWPVFWLMPQTQQWPPEFDIAEYYAGASVMHHGLCHGDVHNPIWDSTGDKESEAETDFHTYGLEWAPGRAVWYEDGKVKKIVEADYVPDSAMYVILNNGVSSHIGPSGQPNEATVFPNFFEIDYVRVYQTSPAVAIKLAKEEPAAPAPAQALPSLVPSVIADALVP